MDFLQVDVFADAAYTGNPLAVFPEVGELTKQQMQAIAREMNLSETTFVTSADTDSYRVRIFTPTDELPFAGHPTLGTAWTLRELGIVSADSIQQHSAAGTTGISFEGEHVWLQRPGSSDPDLVRSDPASSVAIAESLGLRPEDVRLEARELGRGGVLDPAYSDAGLRQLMVPVRDLRALETCRPVPDLVSELAGNGMYCFTAYQAGRVRCRGFFPGVGIAEDPATGSAAAGLGLYLADRVGVIELEALQGVEMGRPSRIQIRAEPGRVRVGGLCALVLRGQLKTLPS